MRIETEKLILRNYRETDLDDYWGFVSQPNIGSRCGWPVYTDKTKAKERLKFEMTRKFQFAIELKLEQKVIGSIEIAEITNSFGELGGDVKNARNVDFLLNENYWNGGIMTEALTAVVNFCFKNLGLKAVMSGYFAPNVGSCKVQTKVGFRYFKTLKNAGIWYGSPCDLIVTKLTKDEWLNRVKKD